MAALTFDDIAPPIPEGYTVERLGAPSPPTWGQRLRKAIAGLARRLLRLATDDSAAPDVVPLAQPEIAPARPADGEPSRGRHDGTLALLQLPEADSPRLAYVRPDELADVWPLLAPHLQALRPRQNVGDIAKAAASEKVALWVVCDPSGESLSGALIVGAPGGAIQPLASTKNFAKRWPTFTPYALVCEAYRTQCRRVAPTLLSAEAMCVHQLHTLN